MRASQKLWGLGWIIRKRWLEAQLGSPDGAPVPGDGAPDGALEMLGVMLKDGCGDGANDSGVGCEDTEGLKSTGAHGADGAWEGLMDNEGIAEAVGVWDGLSERDGWRLKLGSPDGAPVPGDGAPDGALEMLGVMLKDGCVDGANDSGVGCEDTEGFEETLGLMEADGAWEGFMDNEGIAEAVGVWDGLSERDGWRLKLGSPDDGCVDGANDSGVGCEDTDGLEETLGLMEADGAWEGFMDNEGIAEAVGVWDGLSERDGWRLKLGSPDGAPVRADGAPDGALEMLGVMLKDGCVDGANDSGVGCEDTEGLEETLGLMEDDGFWEGFMDNEGIAEAVGVWDGLSERDGRRLKLGIDDGAVDRRVTEGEGALEGALEILGWMLKDGCVDGVPDSSLGCDDWEGFEETLGLMEDDGT
ncbi:expressed unknown protein [Seminavis robusta]|uniref:Uncharacterized protein n=1 Tax=Seminavis robusta TaxID=568900 RepID=A0A9N8E1E6_9STRA|nr:expressed unknown protein [Seminavis robusta]|eukprot:Sro554_g165450.1 n/a (415) ;mRNA; f:7795-9104